MNKITEKDLANRGVKGLPDVPGLTTEEMQRKLDEIAREILVPKVNEIIDNLIAVNSNLSKLHSVEVTITSDVAGRFCINDFVDIPKTATNVVVNVVAVDGVSCSVPNLSNTWKNKAWYSYLLSDDYTTMKPNMTINCRISWVDGLY